MLGNTRCFRPSPRSCALEDFDKSMPSISRAMFGAIWRCTPRRRRIDVRRHEGARGRRCQQWGERTSAVAPRQQAARIAGFCAGTTAAATGSGDDSQGLNGHAQIGTMGRAAALFSAPPFRPPPPPEAAMPGGVVRNVVDEARNLRVRGDLDRNFSSHHRSRRLLRMIWEPPY